MKIETAREILEALVEGDYPVENSEDDDEAIKEAEYFAKHADAVPAADRDATVKKILKIVEEAQPDDGYVPEDEEPSEPLADTDSVRTTEHEAPDLPYDITKLKDIEVRRLSSRFQVHLNEVVRELATVATQVLRAKQLREAEYRKAYVAEANAAREAGTKLTNALLEMAATQSPAVQEKDNEVFELEVRERDLKALRDIYKGNVDRLSRDLTMRADEMRSQSRRH